MAVSAPAGSILARGFDWKRVTFPAKRAGDFAKLIYGRALREPDRRPGDIPVYGTNGRTGWHDQPLHDGPGVILGRKGQGHLGVKWCNGPFWVIDTAYFADLDYNVVDPRWFYYIAKYVGLDHLKSGPKPGLNRDVFCRQLFPFPELEQQREIARILGQLDDKIELNRRMNETLEATARAIFRSWFVDFDPVLAKAAPGDEAGRPPAHMSKQTADLFPDHFEDSELGPIPTGWKVGTIADVLSIQRDSVSPNITPDQLFDHYSIPAFDAGHWPVAELGKTIKSNKYLVPAETVLISKLNPRIPRVWLPQKGTHPAICSTEFLVTSGINDFSREYVYGLLSSDSFRDEFATLVTGTSNSHQRVKPNDFLRIPTVIPDSAVVKKYGDVSKKLIDRLSLNLSESHVLETTRDALLSKLLSGEIRLRNAQTELELIS